MEWTKNQHTQSAGETIGIAGNFFAVIVLKCSFVEVIISKSLGKTVQLQCTISLSGASVGSALGMLHRKGKSSGEESQ